MNARALAAILLAMAAPAAGQEHGFAGLGTDSADYARPVPGHTLEFPRDHGAHPRFRIEWWYLTANLRGADGRDYGAQWTLFRSALAPRGADHGWASPQMWMAHAALTAPESQHVAERFARGGIGQAGVTADPFAAWIDDWQMRATGDGGDDGGGIAALHITARGSDFSYALDARATGPIVRQGEGGYSVKGPGGQASYYYSQPFYRVSGTITLPRGEGEAEGAETISVSGRAWLDREWSSQPLAEGQSGWDWFALHLDDGRQLMVARVRGRTPFAFGSIAGADGQVRALGDGEITLTPGGGDPPRHWRVEVPVAGVDLVVAAINPDSFMTTSVPYWEGPVRVTGSQTGTGYLEMTGYGRE